VLKICAKIYGFSFVISGKTKINKINSDFIFENISSLKSFGEYLLRIIIDKRAKVKVS